MKRAIQTHLQNHLAELILQGEVADGAKVKVSVKGDALDFKITNAGGDKSKADKKTGTEN